MPMMADLDDPPRSRWRGLLIGLLVALPFGAALAWGLLPFLYGQLTGGAADFDARLRQEDAYMQGLCTEAMVLPRDESLCECVLAIEYPSLDCRPQFLAWTLERQAERCSDDAVRADSVSFCACVEAVTDKVSEAEDDAAARQAAQRYAACTELEDTFALPSIAELQAQQQAAQPESEPQSQTSDG